MKDKLDNYIESVEHLPATPVILVKLITLFQQRDRDVDEIVELLSRDPAMTAEVLRYSNSAGFGHEEQIVDIFEAIMRVGFHKVYQSAMARFGLDILAGTQHIYAIDVTALWRHSAAAAATAGAIARKTEGPEGLAFTAGLLHDVGKIVLASAEGAQYGQLINEFGQHGSVLETSETKLFGFRHSEVGCRLLHRWKLPEDISAPVAFHHRVDWNAESERLCAIVSLGNCMAHVAEADAPQRPYDSEEAVCAMRVLQLREADMALLLQDAQDDIKRLAGMLVPKTN